MRKYSPGASITDNYYYICDMCEKDDGRDVLVWRKLSKRKGHFALCYGCISRLYFKYVSELEKQGERIFVARKGISEELREKIFKRDGYKCVYCSNSKDLQIDHKIPFSKGGTTTENNLQTLCKECNLKKRIK